MKKNKKVLVREKIKCKNLVEKNLPGKIDDVEPLVPEFIFKI